MTSQLRYVLITGCSDGGIGSALAEQFHVKGLHVFATTRDTSKMQDLRDLSRVTFLDLDVTSSQSIAAAYKAVEKETCGKLHYLVNNSGMSYGMPLLDSDIERSQQVFDVNVWGVVRVTQIFAPLVISAKGTIVNNTSMASCTGLPYSSMYCGSKAAARLMSEAMTREMKPLGVKVVTVITGSVSSQLHANSPEFALPPGSYYAPIEELIGRHSRGEQIPAQMPAKEYAETVVGDVLGGAQGTIWRGAQTSMVKFSVVWLPTWLLDILLVRGTGLDTLKV